LMLSGLNRTFVPAVSAQVCFNNCKMNAEANSFAEYVDTCPDVQPLMPRRLSGIRLKKIEVSTLHETKYTYETRISSRLSKSKSNTYKTFCHSHSNQGGCRILRTKGPRFLQDPLNRYPFRSRALSQLDSNARGYAPVRLQAQASAPYKCE